LAQDVESGLVKSKSEGRRLCAQKGVRLDGLILDDPFLQLKKGGIIQAGKRRFMRIILGNCDQL
jgi:tyrosyl-tRNA synthetase